MKTPKSSGARTGSSNASSAADIPLANLHLPEFQKLAAKLRFSPSEGRIWLDNQRMAMLSSESFAVLRTELIETLGLEAARGLLTRLAYSTGCRDAETALKQAGPNASLSDVLESGRFMRSLQGYGLVEPLSVYSEGENFNMQFEWLLKDSLESEVHFANHGIGSIPACWMEAGYSSGYFTTFAGKRMLGQEVECRALGSDHCRFVAKPVECWTDAREDLAYFELEAKVAPRSQPASPASQHDPHAPHPVATSLRSSQVVGAAAAFNVVLHKIRRVAPTNATVLLLGESGTGKSMFARELHNASLRANAPFIEVNCAAIPEALIESELFGVERGAYSGASNSRPGRFEIANNGTIFLDEISSLSITAQGKLLRVLQSGEMERLGSTTTIQTDVRVIAATNEDLRIAIKEQRFRADLFFRLNVFPIAVQPLRERRDDIPLLAEAFRTRFCKRHNRNVPGITSRAVQAMLIYKWPGNIRELENVIERGVILAQENEPIDIHHVFSVGDSFEGTDPLGMSSEGALVSKPSLTGIGEMEDGDTEADEHSATLDEIAVRLVRGANADLASLEDAMVRAALREVNGNVAAAARVLGVSRAQMDYRVKKL